MAKTLELMMFVPLSESRLKHDFFRRSAESVAQDLLGRILVRTLPNQKQLYGMISEVAAFEGKNERAHKVVNYDPGIIGVSQRYGKFLLDISTNSAQIPSCITIRSIYVPSGEGIVLVQGPGNVTKYLHIDQDFDGASIEQKCLWIAGNQTDKPILSRSTAQQSETCRGIFYFK